MALYTQKAIMRAFGEMLEEMPFDKITVTALVKRCDISSNTFYYHYRDIYDLLDAWFHLELGRFTGEGTDWHTSTKAVMRECQAHPAKIYHVFNALSRDRMEQYVFSLTDDTFFRLVQQQTADTACRRSGWRRSPPSVAMPMWAFSCNSCGTVWRRTSTAAWTGWGS